MSQNVSSSSMGNFSSGELKDYQLDLELLRTDEENIDQNQRLIETFVSEALLQIQNVLTSLRPSFTYLFVTQFEEIYKKQQGYELDPEEFGCQEIEDVLKQLASEKKCVLTEGRLYTRFEDEDIVTVETLEKNEEDKKLLQVGHQGLYKVSLLESLDEIWIYKFSVEEERVQLAEEMAKFYHSAPAHYQVQDISQCVVGRLLVSRYGKMMVRVVVQKVLWGEEMIKVRHVDYGTSVKVNITELLFLHRKFLSRPVLVSMVRLWAVKSVSGNKLEEVGRLQELMRGQKEMGLVVEVMGVGGEMKKPAVVFQQLFEDFSLNFQLLTRGLGEVEPRDFNNLFLFLRWKTMFPGKIDLHQNMTDLLGNVAEVSQLRPKLMTKESVEESQDSQGQESRPAKIGDIKRMQQLLGDIINSLQSGAP